MKPNIAIGRLSDAEEIDNYIDCFLNEHRSQYKRRDLDLSKECLDRANEVFYSFKRNKEDLVNEEDFVNHWTSLQARISATDFFAALDQERSGTLSRHKFIEFWR